MSLVSSISKDNLNANKIIAMSIYVGVPMSSLSILIKNNIGWRWLHVGVGLIGVLLGLLGFVMIRLDRVANDIQKKKEMRKAQILIILCQV